MDVQLEVDKVLEMTRLKLHETTDQNIMLHCLVEQQQAEINKLRTTIDKLGEEVRNGSEDEGKQDPGSVGEEG